MENHFSNLLQCHTGDALSMRKFTLGTPHLEFLICVTSGATVPVRRSFTTDANRFLSARFFIQTAGTAIPRSRRLKFFLMSLLRWSTWKRQRDLNTVLQYYRSFFAKRSHCSYPWNSLFLRCNVFPRCLSCHMICGGFAMVPRSPVCGD